MSNGDWMMRDPDHRLVEAVGTTAVAAAPDEDRAVMRASSALGLGVDPSQVVFALSCFKALQEAQALAFPGSRGPQ